MTTRFDLFDPRIHADPYPHYHALRAEAPVHLEHLKAHYPVWFLTRYEDIVFVLRDPRFSADKLPPELGAQVESTDRAQLHPIARMFRDLMLVRDPPDHTRLRGLVNKAFTPRSVEQLRPRVQEIVDDLLDAALARGRLDLIADVAAPLPVVVISELLGVPVEDRDRLKKWSDDLVPMIDGTIRDRFLPQLAISALELREYLSSIIDERRKAPRDDLISRLLAAQEQDDALSDDEVIATSLLVLAAGHETTTNLIGNGMLALLRHPDQLERLRREPERIGNAVEELLRYDSPVQMTSRRPLEDVEIGGQKIPQGQEVDAVLAAGNRDPAVFPDPDRLDIDRTDTRHLSFGHGIHFCLGAPLARAEGQIAIATLLRRLPRLELAAESVEWRPGLVLRGLRSLPVRF